MQSSVRVVPLKAQCARSTRSYTQSLTFKLSIASCVSNDRHSSITVLPILCILVYRSLPTMPAAPESTTVVMMAVTRPIPAVITGAAAHPFKSAAASLDSNHVV